MTRREERDATETRPVRDAAGRPWWRRRRTLVLASVAIALVALRVALPVVVRGVLESQANALLAGTVTIADVDLWLLRGAIAVEGFSLRDAPAAGDAAPATDDAPPAAAPRFAFRRLLVDVAWWPLASRTVVLEEIALDGPELDLERLSDGTLVLPALRPAEPAPPEDPAATPGAPWNVIVEAARLRDGTVALEDRVPEPPESRRLTLDGLDLLGFRLLHDAGNEEPGKATIEARFGEGTVELETSLATRADGFAVIATLTVEALPLDRLHVHLPEVGWSGFRGRLDAEVGLHLEPDGLPIVWGEAALRDVQVDVPDLEEPALAWRRFEVDLERLDVAQRSVAVRRVALDGAVGLVRPLASPPLPLLTGLARSRASGDDRQAGSPAEREQEPEQPVAEREQPEPQVAERDAQPGEANGTAWSWSVARTEVSDALARIALVPPPLELRIATLEVDGLASTPGSAARVRAQLSEGDGEIAIEGDLGIAPLAARLRIGLDGLALERYAAATGVTPAVLRHGTLGADLTLVLGAGPATVSGDLRVADLDVAPPEGDGDFALAWRELVIGIREIRLPGVPPAGSAGTPGGVEAALERVALSAPRVRVTRTADGVALPAVRVTLGGDEPGAPTTAAETTAEEPAEPAPAPDPAPAGAPSTSSDQDAAMPDAAATPPLRLTLDELTVDGGEITVVDRAVRPFYRGGLSAIALDAHGLAWPAAGFRDAHLGARAPGGGTIEVRARQRGEIVEVTAETTDLALPQLNPYVTGASGYSIASGTFTSSSELRLGGDGFESESALAFDDLEVAGAEGDALFAQRFGVSLTLALALLRDVSGRIALTVPVRGDRSGGARPDLAPIVTEALSRALLNALTSPLKLLGAVALDGDKVTAFAPEPIAFQVGRAEVADDAWWRIDQLTGVLAASPALAVELTGSAGPEDLRALQEAAVLADLQAEEGFLATLRNLPSRGTRNTVRDALAARARGEDGALDAEDAAQLEEWIAAKSIGESELRALAAARGERLRDLLATDYGLGSARVVPRDPAPDAVAGAAQVAVGIVPRGDP